MTVEIETFPTVETWAQSIAGRIEETLGAAVIANGRTVFAGPGGSTPSPVRAMTPYSAAALTRMALYC